MSLPLLVKRLVFQWSLQALPPISDRSYKLWLSNFPVHNVHHPRSNGQKWAEELVETTGKPAALQVTAEKTELKSDGTDLSFIRVAVVDSQGRVVPRSKNHLKFSVTGPAEIIATDNGDATSLLPFQLSERDAYNGLALVILRSQYMKQGKVLLTVESKGLPKQKIALKVE